MASLHVLGSGVPLVISAGIETRGNCHMRIPAERSSTAMMPPPALLKASPNVLVPAETPHPAFASVEFRQLLFRDLPVSLRFTPIEQPAVV